jgi:hypothetical protein
MTDTSFPATEKDNKQPVRAGELAAGGGSGGVLVYAVTSYVQEPKLQSLLLYLVPAASVFATGIYSQLLRRWTDWRTDIGAEKKRRQLLHRAQTGLAEAKQQLESIETDQNATPDHKKVARERVQAFERAVLDLHAKGILTIEPDAVGPRAA